MSLRIWLVRHAQSEWNAEGRLQGRADPPLTALGREQAARVAARLAEVELVALYSSPQRRALETAQAVAEAVRLEPELDTRLQEFDMGEATGCLWDSLMERWPHLEEVARRGERVSRHIPGAEDGAAFHARVWDVMSEVQARHSEGEVAVVAHGGVFSEYLATLLHVQAGYYPGLRFGNASLTLVAHYDDGAAIHFVNETCHLRDLYR